MKLRAPILSLSLLLGGLMPQSRSTADPARMVVGIDEGVAGVTVKAFTPRTHTGVLPLEPYPTTFKGGVRVAAGDVNGDGAPDVITGTGSPAAQVKVFSGRDGSPLHSFL